jgi:ubiquinone/menaquinone biosynthesis C-methylase UbiE
MTGTFEVSTRWKAFYGEFYEGTSEWRELGALDKVDNILALATHCEHATVLDVGAGEGAVLDQLSRHGFADELHALDISESAVEAVRGRSIAGLRACQVFDGYTIPYDDRSFDLAILSHVVEHVEYPRRLLYEAGRVAEHVFVEVPLEDNARAPRDYVDNGIGHINSYSHRTIRKLLQTVGFEIVAQIFCAPSYRLLCHKNSRWRAFLRSAPKAWLLSLWPKLALDRYTYHTALLCKSPPRATPP